MTHVPADRPFRVLFVCTANLCRSPMAEHLLRQELSERGLYWEITSAGTHGRDGQPMAGAAQQELERRSIDVSDWTSHRLTTKAISWADLILTAEAAHRAEVVSREPRALSATFQLLQFARYAAAADWVNTSDALAVGEELVRGALSARAHIPPVPAVDDDIADPMGHRARMFRNCADMLAGALRDLLRPLNSTFGR